MSRRQASILFTLFCSLFIALALVPNTAYADEGELGPAELVTIQEETARTPDEGATIPASNQAAREKSTTNVTNNPSAATGTSASETQEILATPVEDAATMTTTQLPETTTETQAVSTPSVRYAAHVSDQGGTPTSTTTVQRSEQRAKHAPSKPLRSPLPTLTAAFATARIAPAWVGRTGWQTAPWRVPRACRTPCGQSKSSSRATLPAATTCTTAFMPRTSDGLTGPKTAR